MHTHFLLVNHPSKTSWLPVLEAALAPHGTLHSAAPQRAWETLRRKKPSVVIVDAAVEDAPKLVADIRARYPQVRVAVATDTPSWKCARAAFQAGAIDYIYQASSQGDLRRIFASIVVERPASPASQ